MNRRALLLAGMAWLPLAGSGSRSDRPKLSPSAFVPAGVTDLRVIAATDSVVVLNWTEVRSNTTVAAKYEVRWARIDSQQFVWSTATPTTKGSCAGVVTSFSAAGGRQRTCVVAGLVPGLSYGFQVVTYTGVLNSTAIFGPLSNLAEGTTAKRYGPFTVSGFPESQDSVFMETLAAKGYYGLAHGRYPIHGWAPLGLTTLIGFVGDSAVIRGYLFAVRP